MGRKRTLRVRKWHHPGRRGRGHAAARWGGWRIPEMNRISTFRATLVAFSMVAFGGAALAQSPAPSASPAPTPSACPSPAPSAVPAPPPAETKSPADAPTAEKAPAPAPPPPAASVQTADPFGEEFVIEPKKVVVMKGTATWDAAFDTLIDAFKALTAVLDKQGIKAAGNSMIVYTSTDDSGFTFLAQIPVDQDVKGLTKNISMGKSPEGKALKFVHRGSYYNMDNTYEAITNPLDDKKLEAKDTFIEEY